MLGQDACIVLDVWMRLFLPTTHAIVSGYLEYF
jgi:hypothetical protein